MTDTALADVVRLIAAANTARGWGDATTSAAAEPIDDAERQLEARFEVSRTLAVYGTLAPGRPNHRVVAPLGGRWTTGVVAGDLAPEGWGTTFGYPAFRPRVDGAAVAVDVLTSPALASAWPDLDAFEGVEYRRILVPVFRGDLGHERELSTVANLYAAAARRPDRVVR